MDFKKYMQDLKEVFMHPENIKVTPKQVFGIVGGIIILSVVIALATYKEDNIETYIPSNNQTANVQTTSQSDEMFLPQTACHYLDNISGLNTDGYKDDGMGGYFCSSQYKMLDNLSNLAYYGEGTENDINKLYLVLNVYNGSNKSEMHNQLIEASKELTQKATHEDLSAEMVLALQQGQAYSLEKNNLKIQVKRNNWATGKGYDIQYIIEH